MKKVLPLFCFLVTYCCNFFLGITNCAAFPFNFSYPFYSSSIISAKQLNENQPLLKMNVEVLNPIPQIKSSFEELIKESVKQVLARLPLSSISWAAFSNTKKSDK